MVELFYQGKDMKKLHIISFLAIQCITFSIDAEISPHVLTFFIRPLPITHKKLTPDKAEKTIKSPEKIMKALIKKELNELHVHAGIYVSYQGFFAVSDMNGQVVFPRKTAEDKLHFIVTEDVKAVPVDPLRDTTLLGFVPDPNAELQHFVYERRQDPETELYSWVVNEEPLPKAKRIPAEAIVLFANPKHIIVPVGSSHTNESENLVLPDIFTTHNLNSALNALRFFKIRHYFAPVKVEYKFNPDGYQQRIRN
jgi:hypothetical protein